MVDIIGSILLFICKNHCDQLLLVNKGGSDIDCLQYIIILVDFYVEK